MKKKLIALLMMCLILFSLTGCGKTYQEATELDECHIGKGYFITIKSWGGGGGNKYYIVYAKDTKVMYFIACNGFTGITPLYNTDGTLQIYEED